MTISVLIADDSVAIRKVLQKAFAGDSRYDLTLVDKSKDVQKHLRMEPDTDLAIISASLQGFNDAFGVEKLIELSPNLSILMIHGSFDQFNRSALAKAGVSHFLKKPFKLHDLKHSLTELGFDIRAEQPIPKEQEDKSEFEMPLPEQVAEPFNQPEVSPIPTAPTPEVPQAEAFASNPPAMEPIEHALNVAQALPGSRSTMPMSSPVTQSNLPNELISLQNERVFREAVAEYCRNHFKDIAKEILQSELQKLIADKSRLQSDVNI